jgi:opacity protein-like surface antigen
MKKIILAVALLSATAMSAAAQTSAPATSTDGNTPAVATPETKNPTAPVEGANSFTEAQAKSRIEEAGYSDVKDLKKDDKGIWMAAGMKDGKSVMISMDYQGNIVAK